MRYWKEAKSDEKPEAVILPQTGYLTLSTERDLPVGISVVPVAAGALLIEDPDKAVERMLDAAGDGWANATRQIMTRLLHAAAGEGER